jgi:hypothetical protein
MSEIRSQNTEIRFNFRGGGHGLNYLSRYMKNQGLKLNRGSFYMLAAVFLFSSMNLKEIILKYKSHLNTIILIKNYRHRFFTIYLVIII